MGAPCLYCGVLISGSAVHAAVCPMTAVLSDPDRKQAFGMGFVVSTSDWIDAAARAAGRVFTPEERTVLIEMLSLHHQWLDREKAAAIADVLDAGR